MTAFTTLFVIIDPIGLAPIFVALTHGMDAAQRRRIALRAVSVAIMLLTLFLFLGENLLNFVGISMPAFRIAGGLLLFLTALDMLFERRSKRREDKVGENETHEGDPSVFPLAIPLIAGPGALTTIILLAGDATGLADQLTLILVLVLEVLIVLMFFLAAPAIERMLGKTGILVVTRLLGMLLAALAVQFVLDGLNAYGLAS